MGVQVHDAGRDDPVSGVKHAPRVALDAAERHDTTVADTHITAITRHPGPIDDRAAANYEIIIWHGCFPLVAPPFPAYKRDRVNS